MRNSRQFRGDLRRGQDEIDAAGLLRHLWHAGEFGGGRFLRERDTACLFDRLQAERPVGTGAGKDHANCPAAAVLGQGSQEMIDGHVRPRRLIPRAQFQHSISNGQLGVGRYDIDVVPFYRQSIAGLPDRHPGSTSQDLAQAAFVCRIEVLDEYDGKARISRQTTQQKPKCLQSTGGSADANRPKRRLLLSAPDRPPVRRPTGCSLVPASRS